MVNMSFLKIDSNGLVLSKELCIIVIITTCLVNITIFIMGEICLLTLGCNGLLSSKELCIIVTIKLVNINITIIIMGEICLLKLDRFQRLTIVKRTMHHRNHHYLFSQYHYYDNYHGGNMSFDARLQRLTIIKGTL